MFQPTKEWVNKVNLSSFELENFFKFGACVISAQKAKQLDATTMFTYSHANTALGQSERAYYLSYFIIYNNIERDKDYKNMYTKHTCRHACTSNMILIFNVFYLKPKQN